MLIFHRDQEISREGPLSIQEFMQTLVEALIQASARIHEDREMDLDFTLLPDSIDAVRGLGLHCGIPPAAVMKDMICFCNGESNTGHKRAQDQGVKALVRFKTLENGRSVLAPPGHPLLGAAGLTVDDADVKPKGLADDPREHALNFDVPGKDQGLLAPVSNSFQPTQHPLEFGGGLNELRDGEDLKVIPVGQRMLVELHEAVEVAEVEPSPGIRTLEGANESDVALDLPITHRTGKVNLLLLGEPRKDRLLSPQQECVRFLIVKGLP